MAPAATITCLLSLCAVALASEPKAAVVETAPTDDPAASDERFSWRKAEYRVVPYGIGWLSISSDSARTVTGPYTLYVDSPSLQGEPEFSVDARASRLGFEVTGPPILEWESGGRIEIDFNGLAQVENRAGVLLRQAYGEFKRPGYRLAGGQTNDVISPLIPTMLNYTAGWSAGNIGYRRAQARVERFLSLADDRLLTAQCSINQTVVSDFAESSTAIGEDAGWPDLMARAALALGRIADGQRFLEVGISGHIGQQGADFRTPPVEDDRRYLSWSFNSDLQWTVGKSHGLKGEFFIGQALGTFLGGINQGIDPDKRIAIRSIGGWIEAWVYLSDATHCHAGAGIDDPFDADLSAGRRALNTFCFANVIRDFTPNFSVGLEASWWETHYIELKDGRALRLETVMKYHF